MQKNGSDSVVEQFEKVARAQPGQDELALALPLWDLAPLMVGEIFVQASTSCLSASPGVPPLSISAAPSPTTQSFLI